MSLTQKRLNYRPFQYEFCFSYWKKQQQSHWLHTDINLSGDIQDWTEKLTEDERRVVTNILRLFAQTELHVEDYWTRVPSFFPVPEVALMSSAFAGMEGVHAVAYSYLNDSLGFSESEYSAFLSEPVMMEKLEKMSEHLCTESDSLAEKARSLAVFSAFTEGVCLYASFAVLMNFSRSGKLLGTSDLIAYSIRDESLHSEAGCQLFRTLIDENPELWTEKLRQDLYQSARDVVDLEVAFVKRVFGEATIDGVSVEGLVKYIKHRCNVKLGDIGLEPIYEDCADHGFDWVDVIAGGNNHADFFARRVTDYTKVGDFSADDLF